jgi:sarcosine oxidase/L-pipecolate oxidase
MRCAYGADTIYSNLALAAREVFLEWNTELSKLGTDYPVGLTPKDVLYVNCGALSVVEGEELPLFEQQSLDHLTSLGKGNTQFVVNKAEDVTRAEKAGFGTCVDPFNRKSRGLPYGGLLDTTGGLVYADKSCLFALHKARSVGVKFIFGVEGTFQEFLYEDGDHHAIAGVRTADGVEHFANLTIVAGGGWTPTIVPEMDGLCETTAGSVCSYQLPRTSPLWSRFAPENFPTFMIGMRAGEEGGIYGFPRDTNGIVKIGYRGTK